MIRRAVVRRRRGLLVREKRVGGNETGERESHVWDWI
jgi:hypothetical protein